MTILSVGLSFLDCRVVLRSLASSRLPTLSVRIWNNYKDGDRPSAGGLKGNRCRGISLNTHRRAYYVIENTAQTTRWKKHCSKAKSRIETEARQDFSFLNLRACDCSELRSAFCFGPKYPHVGWLRARRAARVWVSRCLEPSSEHLTRLALA